MIASLTMYDRPETAAANDRFWQGIRMALGHGPQTLTRDRDLWDIWQSPDLLFAQTCGMPYRTRLHENVALVGTPDYGLSGCPAGYYNSIFVAQADDDRQDLTGFSGGRFAYNEPVSQSGWAAPAIHMDGLGLHFGETFQSGGHRDSALAVAQGRADFAALDALTWQLIQRYDPFAKNLRVVARTTPTPTLPYITAQTNDVAEIACAVRSAIAALSTDDQTTLCLKGVVDISTSAYLAIPNPAPPPPN